MKLYALLDKQSLEKKGFGIVPFVLTCNKLNAQIIQYRNKTESLATCKKDLITIKKLTNAKVIINDYVQLVEYANGLHVGQEDLSRYCANKTEAIRIIREKIGNKTLGISTHNQKEILEANELDVDYIGLGAYRTTDTKKNATKVECDFEYLASLSQKPVGAIGGVRLDDRILHVTYNVVGSGLYEHIGI